ncbi:MAG: peptide deformylase [Campylobacterota bacterium]|nr:peptide deformylase [Campylobacterota bacterium]
MILDIVTYPDKVLKTISTEVESFDECLHAFLDDMYDTMIASNGIGLAAIQVARPIRVLIINLPDEEGEQHKEDLIEMINPVLSHSEGTTIYQEGCLSIPGFYEDVERYEHITIAYSDRHGNEHVLESDGLLSIAIQHEMEHLEGHLFIEKLSYIRRKKFEKEYKKRGKTKKSA